ncbi:MAG: tRNA pseudouridine(38-40) synthase TruA [candidate division WOR-3 bacterium]
MRNIRLTIEFDGTNYAGWQIQPNRPTIQGELQSALKKLFGRDITLYGCGRTDAGVSARNYTANFLTDSKLPVEKIPLALNSYLPEEIVVKKAEVAPLDFHSRYQAKSKTYIYYIIIGRSPLRCHHAWELHQPLDINRLKTAANLFLGKKDFNHFCQTREGNGICQITSIRVKKSGDEIKIAITGDRFLYKMVRRIVGAMVAYASTRLTKMDIHAALAGKKHRPFQTAPAPGLILESVRYNRRSYIRNSEAER